MIQYTQTDLYDQRFIPLDDLQELKFSDKLFNLRLNLSRCGMRAKKEFYCKKPEHRGKRLLKDTPYEYFRCEIRYCSRLKCLVQRFARQIETLNDIERFWNLKKLWHFAIGFEPIPELEFKRNFSKYNKRFQYVLNKYFEKLRKGGLNIEAVRVLDFSFKKEGFVYMHFHFGAVPPKHLNLVLHKMQNVRKDMNKRMKIKTPFHMQTFFKKDGGHPSKEGVLSYLSIRASGMYKYDNTDFFVYDPKISKLIDSIKQKRYIFLNDVITEEEYLRSFYNKPFFVTIGGLPRPSPHGSNITDGIPRICPCCGELDRKDVRICIIFEETKTNKPPPPPDLVSVHSVVRKF